MITSYNILRHELVGLKLGAITDGKRIRGVVTGETSKTIRVKTPGGDKTITKEISTLEFELPGASVVRVEGKLLAGRPEDRVKKKHRIRF